MRLSTSFDCTAAAGYLARGPIPYGVPSVVPGVIIHPAGLPWRNVSIAPLGYKWTPGYSTAPLVISFEVWGYDPQTGNWAILIPRSFVTVGTAESASPALTGNEPPEELVRRVREMRDRGEEPSPEIQAKVRQLFQSGAIQRTGQGGRPPGGAGSRSRSASAWRNIYVLSTNTPPGGGDPVLMPRPVRVKTGITDGTSTEITDGLQEGDPVVTAVKLPAQAASAAPAGQSPFGGPGRMR